MVRKRCGTRGTRPLLVPHGLPYIRHRPRLHGDPSIGQRGVQHAVVDVVATQRPGRGVAAVAVSVVCALTDVNSIVPSTSWVWRPAIRCDVVS